MSTRQRHPNKDLAAVMRLAEEHGWSFSRKSGYFKGRCSCGVHLKTIHLSPSDPNYGLNLRKWFERQSCWSSAEGEGDDSAAR